MPPRWPSSRAPCRSSLIIKSYGNPIPGGAQARAQNPAPGHSTSAKDFLIGRSAYPIGGEGAHPDGGGSTSPGVARGRERCLHSLLGASLASPQVASPQGSSEGSFGSARNQALVPKVRSPLGLAPSRSPADP